MLTFQDKAPAQTEQSIAQKNITNKIKRVSWCCIFAIAGFAFYQYDPYYYCNKNSNGQLIMSGGASGVCFIGSGVATLTHCKHVVTIPPSRILIF